MCGRYASARATADMAADLGADELGRLELPGPSWNVAPGTAVRIVVPGESRPTLTAAMWGWTTHRPGASMLINARSETVTEKPTFARAARERRCLVPADGWYEWQRAGSRRTPYYFHAPDGHQLTFAGLLRPESEDAPASVVILTRAAVGDLGQIHDRMPVIIPADVREEWASADQLRSAEVSHLVGTADLDVVAYEVSSAVGSVRNNTPDLLRPVSGDEGPADGALF